MAEEKPRRETLMDIMQSIAMPAMMPVWIDGKVVMEPVPVPLPNGRKWSRERLIKEARAFAEKMGRAFTLVEFTNHLKTSDKTLYRYFDDWKSFLTMAGLQPIPRTIPRLTDEGILDEYGRLQELLGRPPSYSELDRLSAVSRSTLYRRFGRRHGLEAAYERHRASKAEAGGSEATRPE